MMQHNTDTLRQIVKDWYAQANSEHYDGSLEPEVTYDDDFDEIIIRVETDWGVFENDSYIDEIRDERESINYYRSLEGMWNE